MVFEKLEKDKGGYPDFGSQRVVGFYTNKDDAFHDVQINALDIREYTYNYTLIERVEEGFYGSTHSRYFFKYNEEKNMYEEINEPDYLNNFIGFTIG
jgi:hypothetical protein